MRRLAYLTNVYPSISHTFIRRELLELERRGHSVLRLAIRPPDMPPVDPADKVEYEKTHHCLAQPLWRLTLGILRTAVTRPIGFLRSAWAALCLGWRAERGLLLHAVYLLEAAYLLQVLLRDGVEHVHVHFGTNPAAIGLLIRRMGGPTYSITVHGPGEFDAPRTLSLVAKVTDASFVAAISSFCSAQLWRWLPFDQWSKVHIVRCAVGEDFFEHRRPVDPDSNRLVCIGRLSSSKGHMVLLEAMTRLAAGGTNVRLTLAGDGPLRTAIERRIAELRLEDHIEVTGWIDETEVRRQISAARAVVSASFAEGLPVVMMEALAMGRPVVATYFGGIPELVRPGENGWLVPPGDAEALAEALGEVMRTPAERLTAMGEEGRRRVRDRHRTATEAARLERLLAFACGEGHGHSA
ncbi:MAG: glycosyltransferase family 4 protein [Planctomycetes bacterium]|nr:glycosyltransferase family 4 protein [Planctomycetota bacterium]